MVHPNSKKNLRPAAKGEVRNPEGRPPIGKRYAFVLPPELVAKLDDMAEAAGLSRSEMLRQIIADS